MDLTSLGLAPVAPPDLSSTDPADKTPLYIRQWGLWFLSAYQRSGTQDFHAGFTSGRYALAERYLNGEHQPTPVLKDDKGEVDAERMSKLDFRPLPCLKRPMRALDGLLADYQYDPTCSILDDEAVAERNAYEGQARAAMEVGPRLQQMGLEMPLPEGMSQPPLDEDDLGLHMESEYQHPDGRVMEKKLLKGLDMARYGFQEAQLCADAYTYGVRVQWQKPVAGVRIPTRIRPHDAFILPSQDETFSNLQGGAHLEHIPLSGLKAEVAQDPTSPLSKQNWESLKSHAEATLSSGGRFGTTSYDQQRERELAGLIPVIRFSFIATELVTDSQGGQVPTQFVYEGTLLPGISAEDGQWVGYNCRKAFGQLRAEDNPLKALPLYTVYAPGLIGGKTRSLVEDCMPAYDGFNREFIKMQDMAAKSPQAIIQFNPDAIRAHTLERGAEKTEAGVQQAIRTMYKHGWILGGGPYVNEDGDTVQADTVKIIPNDISAILAQHWNSMQSYLRQIEDLTGINQSVAAGNAKQDVAAKSQEIAIQGSVNALNFLSRAKEYCFLHNCRAMSFSIQDAETPAGEGMPPKQPLTGEVALPGGAVEVLAPRPSLALDKRRVYVLIERLPLEQEKQEFTQQLGQYTIAAPGQQALLTPADIQVVQGARTLKDKWYKLATLVKRNRQAQMQQAQQQSEMQSQSAMQANEQSEMLKAQNAEAAHGYKMAEIAAQGEWSLKGIYAQAEANASNLDKQLAVDLQKQAMMGEQAASKHERELAHDAEQQDADRLHESLQLQDKIAGDVEKEKAKPKPKPAAGK
ncbi:hypothetical protein [Hymenobacter glacieicola]|uniref:Portal protein n=1 Tax=Hymenobacter glacieicola TaxID=1562124 RepID=A0ABQ1X8M4_9BACT|nr:hypothetical protein [Hymenobacter glacieicola]GGG61180.1 hypothetical protein GCM10011378_41480 [Hymenobacter glacieicola]